MEWNSRLLKQFTKKSRKMGNKVISNVLIIHGKIIGNYNILEEKAEEHFRILDEK